MYPKTLSGKVSSPVSAIEDDAPANPLVEDYPLGYPRVVAALLGSADELSIYRRYGYLHARLLLHKQDQLRILEEDLDQLDRKDFYGTAAEQRCLKSRVLDSIQTDAAKGERDALLAEIEKKLLEYGTKLRLGS